MLPVCVHVCVCGGGEKNVLLTLRASRGLGARAQDYWSKDQQLYTLHRGRERDQTCRHVLNIRAVSICLAEDYPQLSAPVTGRKGGQQAPLTSTIYDSIDKRCRNMGVDTEKPTKQHKHSLPLERR